MKDKQVRDWWRTQIANNYFKKFSFGFSYKNMARFKLQNKHILEIGFGYGRELSQFCKVSNKVIGIDISPAAIPLTKRKLWEQGISQMPTLLFYDGLNMPFKITQFDFIYSCFVIQHMSRDNAKKLIKNALEILKDDGTILFEFFGHPEFMIYDVGRMYNNAYTKEEIIIFINECGGKIDFIEEWPIKEKNGRGEMLSFNNHWVCIKK